MENRFELGLDSSIPLNSINTAVVIGLTTEYVMDLINDVFKKYNNDDILSEVLNDYTVAVENTANVSFIDFDSWNTYKSNVFLALLDIVKRCDEVLSEKEIIARGDISEVIQMEINDFVLSLGSVIVDDVAIDFGELSIKTSYVETVLEQMALVNECVVLCKLASMQIEMIPTNVTPLRNKFIEEKLSSIEKITASSKKTFEEDYDKLLDDIMSMNSKFYKISNDTVTDAEKVDKARNLVRNLNSHKKVLDKLENKLSKGNELKRQLTLHKKKLSTNLEEQNKSFDESISANPEEKDIIESSRSELHLVTDQYFTSIDNAVAEINDLEEKISVRYKMLDLLETSLKSSIPTEGEMKKFSQIAYKFEELIIKLEQAKTNITDAQIKDLIKSAIVGLEALVYSAKDLKELYMRNALVSAAFKTNDVLYDFAQSDNKAERLQNMFMINQSLEKYNKLALKMSEDFFNCRKVANDTIRNIALLMCKNYTKKMMNDIIKSIDSAFKSMKEYIETIESDNGTEIELIKSILTM